MVLDSEHAICVSPNVANGGLYLHLCGDGFAPLERGNTGIGFAANDFDGTCEEMKQKGVQFSQPPSGEDGVVSQRNF